MLIKKKKETNSYKIPSDISVSFMMKILNLFLLSKKKKKKAERLFSDIVYN